MSVSAQEQLRRSCRRTLLDWPPPTAEQGRLRQVYLDHLNRHGNGWSRRCSGAHLTASSLICAPLQREVLLTLHARIGRWLQTGGHIEAADPSLEAAALREAVEESGLEELQLAPSALLLSRHEVPCGRVRPAYHLDVQFLVVAPYICAPRVSAESRDVRWFNVEQLPDLDSSVLGLVAAAAERLGW